MARRGGEAAAKRARERARQAKRQAKEVKREARAEHATSQSPSTEAALMEEFARLSAEYEANLISHDSFTDERRRILTELGIDTD
jgi:hypothetical protein